MSIVKWRNLRVRGVLAAAIALTAAATAFADGWGRTIVVDRLNRDSDGKITGLVISLGSEPFAGKLSLVCGNSTTGAMDSASWEYHQDLSTVRVDDSVTSLAVSLPSTFGTTYRYARVIFEPTDFTVKAYAQDGLVALWDGYYNVGGATHDKSAIAWTDAVNGYSFTLSGSSFDDYGLVFTGGYSSRAAMTAADTAAVFTSALFNGTVEAAYRHEASTNPSTILQTTATQGVYLGMSAGGQVYASNKGTCYSPVVRPNLFHVLSVGYASGVGKIIDVDGGLAVTNGTSSTIDQYSTGAWLGARNNSSQPYPLQGHVYSLRVYNRALSDAEVDHNTRLDYARYQGQYAQLATASPVYNSKYEVDRDADLPVVVGTFAYNKTATGVPATCNNLLYGLYGTCSSMYTENGTYTDPYRWTDGNIFTPGPGVNNSATVTYNLLSPSDVYGFRWCAPSWTARDYCPLASVVFYDELGNSILTLGSVANSAYDKVANYVMHRGNSGLPIVRNASKVVFTMGTPSTSGQMASEIELIGGSSTNAPAIRRLTHGIEMTDGYYDYVVADVVGPADAVRFFFSTNSLEVESETAQYVEVAASGTGEVKTGTTDLEFLPSQATVYWRAVAYHGDIAAHSRGIESFEARDVYLAIGSGGDNIYFAKDGSGDIVHEFTTPGTGNFTAPTGSDALPVELRILAVGGGAAGRNGTSGNPSSAGGGGDGGEAVSDTETVDAGATFAITIGAGGVQSSSAVSAEGPRGADSLVTGSDFSITAAGGTANTKYNAGGKGAGGAASGYAGGAGIDSDITGESVVYSGGGGSGSVNSETVYSGGGAGGAGGSRTKGPKSGVRGGGGGGTNNSNLYAPAGNGGDGLVIFRYTPSRKEEARPFGRFTAFTLNDDATAYIAAYINSAGTGCLAVSVDAVWGDSATTMTNVVRLSDAAIANFTCDKFELPFGKDIYMALKFTNANDKYLVTATRVLTVPAVSGFTPNEPDIDEDSRTIGFYGSLDNVGFGDTTLTLIYGSSPSVTNKVEDVIVTAWGETLLPAFDTGAISCQVARQKMPVVYYKYVLVETAAGRELKNWDSGWLSVRVYIAPGTVFGIQ